MPVRLNRDHPAKALYFLDLWKGVIGNYSVRCELSCAGWIDKWESICAVVQVFGSSPKKLQIEQKDYIKTSFPQRRESSKKP